MEVLTVLDGDLCLLFWVSMSGMLFCASSLDFSPFEVLLFLRRHPGAVWCTCARALCFSYVSSFLRYLISAKNAEFS